MRSNIEVCIILDIVAASAGHTKCTTVVHSYPGGLVRFEV